MNDLPAVADFLSREYGYRSGTAGYWLEAITAPWPEPQPNCGFMVLENGDIAGVYVAYYSRRRVSGRVQGYCCLGPWCMREDRRWQAPILLKAVLNQPGWTFVDVTPIPQVVAINRRLGMLDVPGTEAVAVPSLPWPTRPGRWRITHDPDRIGDVLAGDEAGLFSDHRDAPGVEHALIERAGTDAHCYVVFRRQWRRSLPIANLIHVSDPGLLRSAAKPFARYLLRRKIVAMMVEARMVADYPGPWLALRGPRVKMYRPAGAGAAPPPDDLYSELVCRPPAPRSDPD